MKLKAIKSLLFSSMVVLCSQGIMAKDIYISSEGNDTNDGLSAVTARKTLTSLNDIVAKGDIVHINGLISMDAEFQLSTASLQKKLNGVFYSDNADYTASKENGFNLDIRTADDWGGADAKNWAELTFVGENPEQDGFDGDGKWRFFDLSGRDENATFAFKNLRFQNGVAPAMSGVIILRNNANVSFDNCTFSNNSINVTKLTDKTDHWYASGDVAQDGTVIHFQTGNLTLNACRFIDNMCSRNGGAIGQTGGKLMAYNCLFDSNRAMHNGWYIENTTGGAVSINPRNIAASSLFDGCSFVNNCAWVRAGGVYVNVNRDDSSLYADVNLINCYFYNNDAYKGLGGAVMVDDGSGDDATAKYAFVKIANTTIYQNTASTNGPAIFWRGGWEGSMLHIANSTITGNVQNGSTAELNAGHGSGICFRKEGSGNPELVDKLIVNSIVEGNHLPEANSSQMNDLTFGGGASDAKLSLINSHIGRVTGYNTFDTNNYPTSQINYINQNGQDYADKSVLDLDGSLYAANTLTHYSHPWGVFPVSDKVKAANQEYYVQEDMPMTINDKQIVVSGYDITDADQNGISRSGKHYVGASMLKSKELATIPQGEVTEYKDPSTGNIKLAFGGYSTSIAVSNGIITSSDESAEIVIYNINGMKVGSAVGTYNTGNLSSGVYIVKANSANGISVMKYRK